MKIYTKTGDKGETSLFGGIRVLKSDLKIDAYGSIDELNSAIGVIVSEGRSSKLDIGINNNSIFNSLFEIQKDLLLIGSLLAGYKETRIKELRIKEVEKWIDKIEKQLPELKHFIIPGGCKSASFVHLARSICRRAERRVVKLSQITTVDNNIIVYLNRLSDLLFVLARYFNLVTKTKEYIWKI